MFPMTVSVVLNTPEDLVRFTYAFSGASLSTQKEEGLADVIKETPKPKKETKAAPVKEEPKTEAAQEVTRADVSKLAVALATKGKRDDVVSILAEFGAQAVTGSDSKPGLSDEDLAAAHAKLSAVAV